MSEPNNENNVPSDAVPKVEILPPGLGGLGRQAGRQSFLQSYLRKGAKITVIFAIIGCCFMLFAAWTIVSTFERILTAASAPLGATPGK